MPRNVIVTGIRKTGKAMQDFGDKLEQRAKASLYRKAQEVMTDAKRRTPVDDGHLRASGYVTRPTQEGSAWVCEVGFGGPAAPYALIQHEELGFRHRVGEAKYLENAVKALAPEVLRDIQKVVTDSTKQNGGGGGGD